MSITLSNISTLYLPYMRKLLEYCCNLFLAMVSSCLIAFTVSEMHFSWWFFKYVLMLSTARVMKLGVADKSTPNLLLDLCLDLVTMCGISCGNAAY